MVKNMSMIAIVLIIIGITGMLLYKFDIISTDRSNQTIDKTWVLGTEELKNLNIYGGSMNVNVEFINIKMGDAAYVHVKGPAQGDVLQQIETAALANNKLSLDLSSKQWRLFSFNFSPRTMYVTVALPEQEKLDLVQIKLDSGNGSYTNLKGKDIQIEVSSGNIQFNNLEGDDINLRSTSGNIKGTGIAGNIHLSSTSGNITIDDLAGNLDADSRSGNINITQITPSDSNIQTSSGNVVFTTSEDFIGFYDLRASSGNIRAPESEGLSQNIIKIRTNSGNIRVK